MSLLFLAYRSCLTVHELFEVHVNREVAVLSLLLAAAARRWVEALLSVDRSTSLYVIFVDLEGLVYT